jgi:hypothetical protein
MPIESVAMSNELDSPYYLENKEVCELWNDFVESKNGTVNGKYNAWSFGLKATIKTTVNWTIIVKRSTYTGGFLFISSKEQNVQETLAIKTSELQTDCGDFYIRKPKWKDLFIRNKREINGIESYCYKIYGKSKDHPFAKAITELVYKALTDDNIYVVNFTNSELQIVLHDRNRWFNLVEKILAFSSRK